MYFHVLFNGQNAVIFCDFCWTKRQLAGADIAKVQFFYQDTETINFEKGISYQETRTEKELVEQGTGKSSIFGNLVT
jgi:hypothetical protein